MARFSSLDKIGMLRSATGDPATGDVPDAELAQHIWLAEMDIAEMYEFANLRGSENVVTEAGTELYEMTATDILKFLEPANNLTTGIPMTLRDADWYRNTGIFLGQQDPFYYWEEGLGANGRRQVQFCPKPGGINTIRIAYIKVPTAPDSTEANFSDLPQGFDLQVLNRATEISLEMQSQRDEAKKQTELSGKSGLHARRSLPAAAYYKQRIVSFKDLIGRRRR